MKRECIFDFFLILVHDVKALSVVEFTTSLCLSKTLHLPLNDKLNEWLESRAGLCGNLLEGKGVTLLKC